MTNLKQWANATNLKFLAIVLMFLDHIHEMFLEFGAPSWLNMLGRLVFPIFLFLAADSFHYTHSRRNYMLRLFAMSCFMTIGNGLIGSLFSNGAVGLANNAFSTFFMTGILITAWDHLKQGIQIKDTRQILKGLGIFLLPVLLTIPVLLIANTLSTGQLPELATRLLALVIMIIPNLLTIEGGFLMALLGLFFYIFRANRWGQSAALIIVSLICYLTEPSSIQWVMVFALLPLWLYNGQKGRGDKRFFYLFYPSHIYALYILASLLH